MTLENWLKENQLNSVQLARNLGVAGTTITRLTSGKSKWLSLSLATKLYKITNGEVTPNDIFPCMGKSDADAEV